MKDHDWQTLLFTDESIFELNYLNKILWFQEASDLENLKGNYFMKNEKVMIAGVVSFRGKSKLKMWRITNQN
jgi:hypothetical protein